MTIYKGCTGGGTSSRNDGSFCSDPEVARGTVWDSTTSQWDCERANWLDSLKPRKLPSDMAIMDEDGWSRWLMSSQPDMVENPVWVDLGSDGFFRYDTLSRKQGECVDELPLLTHEARADWEVRYFYTAEMEWQHSIEVNSLPGKFGSRIIQPLHLLCSPPAKHPVSQRVFLSDGVFPTLPFVAMALTPIFAPSRWIPIHHLMALRGAEGIFW